MQILVIAEHDGKSLKPATLNAVTAAHKIGDETHVLVCGHGCQEAAKAAAQIKNVGKVICVDAPAFDNLTAENMQEVVLAVAKNYTHILAPASSFGKNFMPRVAAQLDVMQISDVVKIHDAETFDRPIYAGNAITTIRSSDAIKIMTVRPTVFGKAELGGSAPIETLSVAASPNSAKFIALEASVSERPELTSAKIIVSGGRGLGSKESFKIIEELADCLNAAIGASRAAVDAGYVPNDYQVGQTGKVVAPELYIAVGISGAIQHLAGMKDSKIIIAINKDPDAPIFQIADYGLVGDLFELVPQLTQQLRQES